MEKSVRCWQFQILLSYRLLIFNYLQTSGIPVTYSGNDSSQVYFKDTVKPGELNRYFFTQGIELTHLAERKRSLEQHFLELLDNQK